MAGGFGSTQDVLTVAKFFVSSGMKASGYQYVNSVSHRPPTPPPSPCLTDGDAACKDEGWEQKQRDKTTGKIVPGPAYGGSDAGMKAVVAQIHAMGLKVGLCARLPTRPEGCR